MRALLVDLLVTCTGAIVCTAIACTAIACTAIACTVAPPTAWRLGAGTLTASTDLLALGPVAMDQAVTSTVDVTSTHRTDLRLDGATDSASFQVLGGPWLVQPGGTATIPVCYAPGAAEPESASLALDAAAASGDVFNLDIGLLGTPNPDADGDGSLHPAAGGFDCDDHDPLVGPGATETWYDGTDDDCDGNDSDADGDGYDATEVGGLDCDDGDPAVFPQAAETWYDGTDDDCDGNDDDRDLDGHGADFAGGDDCDDDDPTTSPSDPDPYDGIDNDCDGLVDGDDLRPGVVALSEYLPETRSNTGTYGAYIEVTSTGWREWTLDGWTLRAGAGSGTVEGGVMAGAQAPALLCASTDPALNGGLSCDGTVSPWPAMDGSDDEIVLFAGDLQVDAVAWTSAWPAADGASTQLASDAVDATLNDEPGRWCVSTDPSAGADLGTPGQPNGPCP